MDRPLRPMVDTTTTGRKPWRYLAYIFGTIAQLTRVLQRCAAVFVIQCPSMPDTMLPLFSVHCALPGAQIVGDNPQGKRPMGKGAVAADSADIDRIGVLGNDGLRCVDNAQVGCRTEQLPNFFGDGFFSGFKGHRQGMAGA